jgi:hypothetical protein
MRRVRAPDERPSRGPVRWMQSTEGHIGQQPLFELEGPRTRGEVAHRQYLLSIIIESGPFEP